MASNKYLTELVTNS